MNDFSINAKYRNGDVWPVFAFFALSLSIGSTTFVLVNFFRDHDFFARLRAVSALSGAGDGVMASKSSKAVEYAEVVENALAFLIANVGKSPSGAVVAPSPPSPASCAPVAIDSSSSSSSSSSLRSPDTGGESASASNVGAPSSHANVNNETTQLYPTAHRQAQKFFYATRSSYGVAMQAALDAVRPNGNDYESTFADAFGVSAGARVAEAGVEPRVIVCGRDDSVTELPLTEFRLPPLNPRRT